MRHPLPSELRKRRVTIDLVGCGGTGSKLLSHLADLHVALVGLGHPGLHVTVFDPDTVTEANIGRTRFAPSDIGQSKAAVLVSRINHVHGLLWRGIPQAYQHPYWHTERQGAPPDLLITAVDTLRARVTLYEQMRSSIHRPPRYWLDLGNDADFGQVVLGEPEWLVDQLQGVERPRRLATVVDVFPAMLDAAAGEEPEGPSCTLAAALGRQEADINDHMAAWGKSLVWRLFRDGGLDKNVIYAHARAMRVESTYRTAGGPGRPTSPALPDVATRQHPSRRRRLRPEVRR